MKKLVTSRITVALLCVAFVAAPGLVPASAETPEPRPSAPGAKPMVMPSMQPKPMVTAPPMTPKAGGLTQQKNLQPPTGQQHPMMESVQEPSHKKPIETVTIPMNKNPTMHSGRDGFDRPGSQKNPMMESVTAPPQKNSIKESVSAPPPKKPITESVTAPSQRNPAMETERQPVLQKPVVETEIDPSASQKLLAEWSKAPANATAINPSVLEQVLHRPPRPGEISTYAPTPTGNQLKEMMLGLSPSGQQQARSAAAKMAASITNTQCANACAQAATQCLSNAAEAAASEFQPPQMAPDSNNPYPVANQGLTCNSAATMLSPYQWAFSQIEQCKNTAVSCLGQCGGATDSTNLISQLEAYFNAN